MVLRPSLLLHALLACSSAFRAPLARAPSGIPLHAKDAKPKKGAGISPNLKAKLLQEAESPWRTVRKFIYGAFALSATVGGLTALTQLAAYQQPDAFPLEKSLQNVLVDFSVVAACAYGAKVDGAADADLEEDDDAVVDDEDASGKEKHYGECAWGRMRRTCPCALRVLGQSPPTARALLFFAYLAFLQVRVLAAASAGPAAALAVSAV